MGFSRQEFWSGLPCPPPGDLPSSGIDLGLLHCRQILYHLRHHTQVEEEGLAQKTSSEWLFSRVKLYGIWWSSSVQSFSHVWLFVTPWTAARQASLSITNSRSLLKLMSIDSVMPSNYLILCRPLLLLPSIFPSIRVFSNESALLIKWPKYWSFSFSISPSNELSGLISLRIDWLDFLAVQGTFKSLLQHHSSKAPCMSYFKTPL